MHHLMPLFFLFLLLPIIFSANPLSPLNLPDPIITKSKVSNSTGVIRQEVQFVNLNGTGYIAVDLLKIALEAEKKGSLVKTSISSTHPIKLALLECLQKNKPVFDIVNEIEKEEEFLFGGHWIETFIDKGRIRCMQENYDLRIKITTATSANGTIEFSTSRRLPNQPKSKAIRTQVLVGRSAHYRVNLEGVISHWNKSQNSSIIMLIKNFTAEAIEIGRCGLKPTILNVTETDHVIINGTMVDYFESLGNVYCDYNRQHGSLELTIHSNSSTFGFIRFEVLDHDATRLRNFEKHISLATVCFVIFVAVLCLPTCYCCVIRRLIKIKAKKADNRAQIIIYRNSPSVEEHEMQTFVENYNREGVDGEIHSLKSWETFNFSHGPVTTLSVGSQEPQDDDEIWLGKKENPNSMGETLEEETVPLLERTFNDSFTLSEEPEMPRTGEGAVEVEKNSSETWAMEKEAILEKQSELGNEPAK